jgi:hypothetical protein
VTRYSDYGNFTGNVYLNYGGFQQVREITNYNSDVRVGENIYGIRVNNESYSYYGGGGNSGGSKDED